MSIYTFSPIMLLAIIPQLGIFLVGLVISVLALILKGEQRRGIAWVTAVGLLLTGVATAFFPPISQQGALIFGGMIRWDSIGWLMAMIFCFAGMITVLIAKDYDTLGREGEFYLLLLTSILGMTLMAATSNLIMLFLAIETTSIPLYILAGFFKRDEASAEAGFKYLLYGATTSAVMLYGFSFLFGFSGSGSAQIYDLANALQYMPQYGVNWIPVVLMLLVMVGLAFKISAVPLHFWAPDVYQGAPTPVAGFLSTASKAAGFVVILRIFIAFSAYYKEWSLLLAILSAASMLFGNLQAMRQHNIKRLLAYSSIAQAGYMLVGVAAVHIIGFAGVILYLIAYMVTNLAAFGIISVVEQQVKSDEIADFAGLARRSPVLGLGMLVAFLSLAGIPPFAGFVGKIMLFSSAIVTMPDLSWLTGLVILGFLNSVFALYYYLRVVKTVYQGESELTEGPRVTAPAGIALAICIIGILVVGIIFSPLFIQSGNAISSMFN